MKRLKLALPTAVLTAVCLVDTTCYARPQYMKLTNKPCATCHLTATGGPGKLTDAGKYFKEKKTLDGFKGKS